MRLATLPILGFLCASSVVFAQEKPVPPSEVDQALRDRVAQFMQFTVDRAFSKAYALVADESKDWYLSSGKGQYKKFRIQDIEYSQDLQQATVKTLVTQVFSMQGHEVVSEAPVSDIWKLVDGKWMYFHDPDVFSTPFGDVRINHSAASHAAAVPTDVGPEAAGRMAENLKLEVSASKPEIVFTQGMAGSDEVVIHNGFIGNIDIDSDIVGDYGSFFVQPARSEIASGKDVVLKISYKPSDRVLETNLRVRVQPFGRVVMVPLRLKSPAPGSSSTSAR